MVYIGFDIETNPEPMGRGWQAHLKGHPKYFERGDTEDEAIGCLVRRLNVQHGGLPKEARSEAKRILHRLYSTDKVVNVLRYDELCEISKALGFTRGDLENETL